MRRFLIMIAVAALITGLIGVAWVSATGTQQATNLFEAFLLDLRADLETLRDAALGPGVLLPGWTGNQDVTTQTFVIDLWFDNELLADEIFRATNLGPGGRPEEWFGATSSNPEILARNVRHDLEIAADTFYQATDRPEAWNGAARIYRCDRTLQNLVRLLDQLYNIRPETSQGVIDYCGTLRQEAETRLIEPVYDDTQTLGEVSPLVVAVRGDLERLRDELLGVNVRPEGWIGFLGEDSPTLVEDAFADLDRLADSQLGQGQRPEGWSSFLPEAILSANRVIRFNLELLADVTLGDDTRPAGWQGVDPLDVCSPVDQALVTIAELNFSYVIDAGLIGNDNFCSLVVFTVNDRVENPPAEPEATDEAGEPLTTEDERFIAEANFAFAYLDVAATQYMGIMPGGTIFRAWYRNYNQSNMMFVSGDDFALFIDRRFTTMTEEVFRTLPTLEGRRPLTYCDAFWCNGPGPTPTPTGSGPLLALLNNATPIATPIPAEEGGSGKTQVSWNHIRVTYLLDRPEVNSVQVTLEICTTPEQTVCEPVIQVFDNLTGTFKPVLSTLNGFNVYEFTYGYNTNVIIEGPTLISPDVWISDPTIR